ncbi:hypothetical protein LguiA_010818 [Lonicera macranthoides]
MATLIAPDHPSPVADAEALRKACQGWGTDEKAIILVLGHRNAIQKKLIRQAYEEMYQEDLLKRLESELSGNFEKAVCQWTLEPAERDAVLLKDAITHTIPDYSVIIEISCIRSPQELLAVKNAYQHLFKHSLEEDLAARTTADLRKASKLLVGMVGVHRYDGDEINGRLATSESLILGNAINDKVLNHEDIIRILTTRSKPQLMATLNHYKDHHGTSITKHLVDDPTSEYLAALRTAIRCITNPIKYYEKVNSTLQRKLITVLRNAINRPGTSEDAVTRVIVTRAEKDLEEIKEQYYKRNSVTLDHAVAKDTSGDYKAFLLTLLGKHD